jgi:hypothetical protein
MTSVAVPAKGSPVHSLPASRNPERNDLHAPQTILPQERRAVLEALSLHEVPVLVQGR